MYEYQEDGIRFLRERPRAILGDEAGLGKTRQLLLAAEGRTLVLAPAMILDAGVWEDEHAKWAPDLDLTQVAYTSVCDREKTKNGGSRPLPRAKPEYRQPWDTVILDEGHYIKNRKTTWTMAVKQIAKRSTNLYLATGTPIPNWAHELFVPLQMVRPDDAKPGGYLGSYWRWVEEWFQLLDTPFGGEFTKDIGDLRSDRTWEDFHHDNLDGVFLQRWRDEELADQLPTLSHQWIHMPMRAKQRKAYHQLRKDFIAWTESGAELIAWSKAAQLVKLVQLTTGLELLDPATPSSGKLDELQELLSQRYHPTLVVCHFRATAEACQRRAELLGKRTAVVTGKTSKKDRRAIVRGFQAGEYDVLVGSLEVVSEGLTLTRADTVVFVERSWRPSRNEQALRRIHRIGQTRPVTAVHLVTEKTLDESMLDVLESKTDQQMKALRPEYVAKLV